MTKALYTAEARVTGGRQGHGRTSDGHLDVDLRLPRELGGDGTGTNPEQLFAVGYAACFGSVLGMLGKRMNLPADDAVIDATVMLLPNDNGTFRISAELGVTLPSIDDAQRAASLLRAAHQVCPYSSAIRGNVDTVLTLNGTRL